jgi:hypothetical protein
MSPFKSILLRLGRLIAETRTQQVDPDTMNLHDWADLPAYHPRVDRGCAVLRP